MTDEYDPTEEEDQETPQEPADSPLTKKLRKEIERRDKELAELRGEKRTTQLEALFTEAGGQKQWARAYQGDPTEEGVKSWIAEMGFPVGPIEDTTAAASVDQRLTPPVNPTQVGNPPVRPKETWADFMQRLADPSTHEQAMKDYADGKVDTTA